MAMQLPRCWPKHLLQPQEWCTFAGRLGRSPPSRCASAWNRTPNPSLGAEAGAGGGCAAGWAAGLPRGDPDGKGAARSVARGVPGAEATAEAPRDGGCAGVSSCGFSADSSGCSSVPVCGSRAREPPAGPSDVRTQVRHAAGFGLVFISPCALVGCRGRFCSASDTTPHPPESDMGDGGSMLLLRWSCSRNSPLVA